MSAVVAFLGSTASIGQQDIAGLVLGSLAPSTRWAVSLDQAPGGETVLETKPLGEMTGSARISVGGGSQLVIEGIDPVAAGGLDASAAIPDEERIDRSWKGDLPMTFTTPGTAPGFSAGSLMEEHSRLSPPDEKTMPAVSFAKSTVPLSALAVARFIGPKPVTVEVADLQPIPLPTPRPNQTMLVAANYPVRTMEPARTNQLAEAMLAAYAPDASVVSQDMFAPLFAETPKEKPPIPAGVQRPGDHWWARLTLPSEIYSAAEQKCLAEAVYFEARSEPYKGQVAVAQVVLNRVKNPAYPDSICKVVYQNQGLRNACQFSFACDGIKDVVTSRRAWAMAKKVANDVSFKGVRLDEIGTATHYHATYVRPNWAGVFKKKAKIGLHVFYQTIHGGWS